MRFYVRFNTAMKQKQCMNIEWRRLDTIDTRNQNISAGNHLYNKIHTHILYLRATTGEKKNGRISGVHIEIELKKPDLQTYNMYTYYRILKWEKTHQIDVRYSTAGFFRSFFENVLFSYGC